MILWTKLTLCSSRKLVDVIKIEKTQIFGVEAAIRGMRNPMNSWKNSDSYFGPSYLEDESTFVKPYVGENDLGLMCRLSKAGTDHRKYMRMISVYLDVTAPLYWWKEFDTYKVGTVANSCSTMHRIAAHEFTLDDFSHEHLIGPHNDTSRKLPLFGHQLPFIQLQNTIDCLNVCREVYLETKDKKYWWQMIQLLPSSYNQKRTLMVNYEVLANIYHSRKNHKLDEWHTFCDWIETLPYSEIITKSK